MAIDIEAIRARNEDLKTWMRLPYIPKSLPELVDTTADIDALLTEIDARQHCCGQCGRPRDARIHQATGDLMGDAHFFRNEPV